MNIQSSLIGRVALAIGRVGSGEYESAIRDFDLVFSDGLPAENRFLLLIKVCANHPCPCLYQVWFHSGYHHV